MDPFDEHQFLANRHATHDLKMKKKLLERMASLKGQATSAVLSQLADLVKAKKWSHSNDEAWVAAKEYLQGCNHGVATRHLLVELADLLLQKKKQPFADNLVLYSSVLSPVVHLSPSNVWQVRVKSEAFKNKILDRSDTAFVVWWLLWDEKCDAVIRHPKFSAFSLHAEFNTKIICFLLEQTKARLANVKTCHFTFNWIESKAKKYSKVLRKRLPNLEHLVLHAKQWEKPSVEEFVQYLPNLKSINLMSWREPGLNKAERHEQMSVHEYLTGLFFIHS